MEHGVPSCLACARRRTGCRWMDFRCMWKHQEWFDDVRTCVEDWVVGGGQEHERVRLADAEVSGAWDAEWIRAYSRSEQERRRHEEQQAHEGGWEELFGRVFGGTRRRHRATGGGRQWEQRASGCAMSGG
jgi:hypothetical protein